MRKGGTALCLAVLSALAGWSACFGPPPFTGPYRCGEAACPQGLVCDDGVCCSPLGEPACRSYVLDGGVCRSGATPLPYYEDLDGDGFGNESAVHLYCAPPVFDPYVAKGGDCNDNPQDDVGKLSRPGAEELCDGLDNDCDGQVDEGLSLSTFYEDQDFDGFGDPARPRLLCAAPGGFSSNPGDCAPDDPNRYPGATEACNGLDDDCDGQVESAAPDRCDGLDNDCDGQIDEQPDCGGPVNLLAADVDLTRGAQNLNEALNGNTDGGCVKDRPRATNETFSSPTWTGTSSNSHVFWVQSAKGWDLSRPGAKLRLTFDHTVLRAGNPAWSQHGQPVVFLCDDVGGHLRFVHRDASGNSRPAMVGANGVVDSTIPLAGDSTWIHGGGTNVDLTRVRRVEVMVQPAYNNDGGVPTSIISFQSTFGFQR
ncbi:MAG: putative metal-binding motif-containing protein [Myxococcota bacterium]